MGAKKDIAILGFVRHGERPVLGAVVETVYPVDEEENRIMREDG